MMRALCLLGILLTAGCVFDRREPTGVGFLDVKLVTPSEGARGTPDARLQTPRGAFPVRVAVTALDRNGQPMDCTEGRECFEGLVSFGVAPGWLPIPNPNVERGRPNIPSQRGQTTLKLEAGYGERDLQLYGVFSDVHVWAEEWPEITEEEYRPARYAAGVSEPLFFSNPTVQDIQYDVGTMAPACTEARSCDNTSSPLVGNFVETLESKYLVTGITNEGFFVTDLLDERAPQIGTYPGRFESLFLFNFSYPENLVIGDIVTKIYGTVQEFTGDTQLTFPAWNKQSPEITLAEGYTAACDDETPCPEKTRCENGQCRIIPVQIDEAICSIGQSMNGLQNMCGHSASNIALESIESARVELVEALMPTKFVNCDFDGDGDAPNYNPTVTCNDECLCKEACLTEPGCSELSALHTYGQYTVTIPGPKAYKVNIVTRDSSPTVVPTLASEDGAALVYGGVKVRVRGLLRQTLPARPRWSVVAGERPDFCCLETGDDAARCGEIPLCQ